MFDRQAYGALRMNIPRAGWVVVGERVIMSAIRHRLL